ncbi:MAG: helix-turn-helix domain-containing protein, partial [Acidobacteriota bacterium]
MFLPDSHALLAHPPHRHASAAPPAADGEPVTDDDAQAMWQLARAIEAGVDEDWPLARLARQAGRSRFQVQRLFSRVVGVSPRAFHTGARFAHLKRQLRGGATVTDAIHDAGFGSVSRVYEHLDDTLGMTPSRYRAGGAGEVILYACRETALGWLMLAATPRGVCAAHFGDDPDALVANLERLFPAADRAPSRALDDPELDRWID